MRHALSVILLLVVLLGMGSVAQAVTVQFDGSVATGITGVAIDGDLYDVSFEYGWFFNVYGFGVAPTFGEVCFEEGGSDNQHPCGLGDPTASLAAVDAVNVVLNSAGAVSIGPSSSLAFEHYVIPYMIDSCAEDLRVRSDYGGAAWVNSGQLGEDPGCAPLQRPFAVFSASGIPIPAAVWLFGSGLGLLGWMRRRKTT
jgi:hypothetical protein